jgi:tryptophan-specific transport protein
MKNVGAGNSTQFLLGAFSNLAIVSSFLGVTLGLFDYIADKYTLAETMSGRSKTAAITFLPPTLAGMIFPNGFIYAIGFAGLVATVWTVVVPSLMVRVSRKRFGNKMFRVWGGEALVFGLLIFALINAVCHVLNMVGLVPVFR